MSSNLLKILFVSIYLAALSGCGQVKDLTQDKLEKLYPTQETKVLYHTDWTDGHYPKRISQFKQKPLNFGDIVFIGNSITQKGGDWSERFSIPNVRNRGIAGDVTDGVLLRLDEITYFKPKAVFLLIGINDLFNLHDEGQIPSPEYVGNNILKITRKIHKASRKTKIFVQTVIPNKRPYLKENISIVNRIIQENEKTEDYDVIDLHAQFINKEGLIREDLTNDGTHLSEKGYQVWVDYVKPTVARVAIQ